MLTQIQAAVMAFVTTVVALVVAYVPSLKPTESLIIAASGAALSLGFMIAHAIIVNAHAKVVAAGVVQPGKSFR